MRPVRTPGIYACRTRAAEMRALVLAIACLPLVASIAPKVTRATSTDTVYDSEFDWAQSESAYSLHAIRMRYDTPDFTVHMRKTLLPTDMIYTCNYPPTNGAIPLNCLAKRGSALQTMRWLHLRDNALANGGNVNFYFEMYIVDTYNFIASGTGAAVMMPLFGIPVVGCNAGHALYYSPSTGKRSCHLIGITCGIGWFTNIIGQCQKCARGTYNTEQYATSCTNSTRCATGSFYLSVSHHANTFVCQACTKCSVPTTVSAYDAYYKVCSVYDAVQYDPVECGKRQYVHIKCTDFSDDQCVSAHTLASSLCTNPLHVLAGIERLGTPFKPFPFCGPLNDFIHLHRSIHRYASSIANGVLVLSLCSNILERDRAPPGYYHTLESCTAPRNTVGPGDTLACNRLGNMRYGQYLVECSDALPQRLLYKACNASRTGTIGESVPTECGATSFQTLCGVHRLSLSSETRWDLTGTKSGPLPGTNDDKLADVKGNVAYKGECVPCDQWAPYRCPTAGNFLHGCGGTSVQRDIVNQATWTGTASGSCRQCSNTTQVRELCSSAPTGVWFYTGCNNSRYIRPATLPCSTCSSSVCAPQRTLTMCGGDNAGQCVACTGKSASNSFYYERTDCAWQCNSGYTSESCTTPCLAPTCAVDAFSDVCIAPMQSKCHTCANTVPMGTVRLHNGSSVDLLYPYGGFDHFRMQGLPSMVLLQSNDRLTNIGTPTTTGLNPDLNMRTDAVNATARKCTASEPSTCKETYLQLSAQNHITVAFKLSAYSALCTRMLSFHVRTLGASFTASVIQDFAEPGPLFTVNKTYTVGAVTWTRVTMLLVHKTDTSTQCRQYRDPNSMRRNQTLQLKITRTHNGTMLQIDIDNIQLVSTALAVTSENDEINWNTVLPRYETVNLPRDAIVDTLYGLKGFKTYANGELSVTSLLYYSISGFAWLTFECSFFAASTTLYILLDNDRWLYNATVSGTASKWHHISVSFSTNGLLTPELRLSTTNASTIFDNIILWEKPETCAWRCGPMSRRIGDTCFACRSEVKCPTGEMVTDCTVNGYSAGAVCAACRKPPNNAQYVHSTAECFWVCNSGFFRNSTGCAACNMERVCAVGQYRTLCNSETDVQCVPCTNKFSSTTNEPFYTSNGSGINVSNCDYRCAAGLYINTEETQCEYCDTQTVCGIGETPQRTVTCKKRINFACVDCVKPPPLSNRFITGNAIQPDTDCPTACIAGYALCRACPAPSTNGLQPLISDYAQCFEPFSSDFPSLSIGHQNTCVQKGLVGSVSNVYAVSIQPTYIEFSQIYYKGQSLAEQPMVWTTQVRVTDEDMYADVTVQFVYTCYLGCTFLFEQVYELSDGSEEIIELDTKTTLGLNELTHVIRKDIALSTAALYRISMTASASLRIENFNVFKRVYNVNGVLDPCITCDVSSEQCTPCDTSQVPENATPYAGLLSPTSQLCAWECNEDYRERNGICIECKPKTCSIGEYERDCNICAPCTESSVPASLHGKIVFTSASPKRFTDGCAFQCKSNFFQSVSSFTVSSGGELVCIACSSGTCPTNSFRQNCTSMTDSRCVPCRTICPAGTQRTANCTQMSNTQCQKCNNTIPRNAEYHTTRNDCSWQCPPSYVHNTDDNVCEICLPLCTIGTYSTQCTAANNWTGCSKCNIPANATVLSSGKDTVNSCIWECNSGTRLSQDGECVNVPIVAAKFEPPSCAPCPAGMQLPPIITVCTCIPCVDGKPSEAVWLTNFVTASECQWACLWPHVRVDGRCIIFPSARRSGAPPAVNAIDTTNNTNNNKNNNNKNNNTNNNTDTSANTILAATLPVLVVAVIGLCALLCKTTKPTRAV